MSQDKPELPTTWELLPFEQQSALLPLMAYAVNDDNQRPNDPTTALPHTTFQEMWNAWITVDRLSLSDWATEEEIVSMSKGLETLSQNAPDASVKEIVDCYYV